MRLSLLTVLLLFCLTVTSNTEAQFGFPCEIDPARRFSSILPTHHYLRVNYHETDQRLTIIDWQTREIYQTLATGIEGYRYLGWSTTCRYVAATIYVDGERLFSVWEVESGQQVLQLNRTAYRLRWSPDERYLLAHTFIENNRRADMIIHIDSGNYNIVTWLGNYVWDMPSNRIYAIHRRELDAVHAYDINTGQHLATYAPANQDDRIFVQGLFLSDDRTHIVYYTRYTDNAHIDGNLETVWGGCRGGFAVWNVETVTGQTIPLDCTEFYSRGHVDLSPDHRYFVAGLNVIRIWDLHALTPDFSPNTIFTGPDYQIATIRFLDNQTLETFASGESRYGLRWDFNTGDYLNTFDYHLNVNVNRDGSPIGD